MSNREMKHAQKAVEKQAEKEARAIKKAKKKTDKAIAKGNAAEYSPSTRAKHAAKTNPQASSAVAGSEAPIDASFETVDFAPVDANSSASGVPGAFRPVQPFSNQETAARYQGAAGVTQEQAELAASILKKRRRRKRLQTVAAVLIVLLCLVGVGAAGATIYLNNLNSNLEGEDKQEAQEVREALTPAPIGDDPFYMLLVGCDDREGLEGVRADTTILVRIDPKENIVTLISIPRDTAVQIPGYGLQKFNAAYAYGGPSGTIDATKQLFGVDITHYAEVHFEALIKIIDAIGGVDVDVPVAIDDVDAGGKVDAGLQHLDGEHAMIFARSRSYETGDYQRTTSQRLLIEAAVEKARNMSASDLANLMMQISQSMTTDLNVQQMLGLAVALQDEPELTMYSALPPVTDQTIDGISYVVIDEYTLPTFMEVVNEGGDPSTVYVNENVATTSKDAEEMGIELIVNEGDGIEEGVGQEPYYDGSYYGDPYGYGYYAEPIYYDQGYYDQGYVDQGYVDQGTTVQETTQADVQAALQGTTQDSGQGGYGSGYSG